MRKRWHVTHLAGALALAAMLCSCGGGGGGGSSTQNPPAPPLPSLGSYQVAANTVTVAGFSSGAVMAVQVQVANSASIYGSAIVAGMPYYCDQDVNAYGSNECQTAASTIPVPTLVNYANTQAAAGNIDPTSNLGGKPIYMFSGTGDTVIRQTVMDDLQQFYLNFTNSSNITYNNSTAAEHGWISPDGGIACNVNDPPFINNCGIDVEQAFLTMFYGTLAARNAQPQGQYLQFNQNEFCAGGNCGAISMDNSAWLYVPKNCAAAGACKLVVMLHGCNQNQASVGTALVKSSGINEWADNNNILVLYPQIAASSQNINSCWDYWGYTGPNYALKSAPQITAIMNMVHRITGG